MFLRVDDRALTSAAERLRQHADDFRDLAAAVLRVPQPQATPLRRGYIDLVEVCADAAELLAMDVELLTARLRAGARLYDSVERAVASASDPRP